MELQTENVWNYPRPAVCEAFEGRVKIIVEGITLAETSRAYRTLETSHPPNYYFPQEDVRMEYLKQSKKKTLCEWKGQAHYFDFISEHSHIHNIGWYYQEPKCGFYDIKAYISFYASKADECFVNSEKVLPQEGDFYGGWITSNLKGPFKGGEGTLGW